VFRRVLTLHRRPNCDAASDVYELASVLLSERLGTLLGAAALAQWPSINWRNDHECLVVNEWQSEAGALTRLLIIELQHTNSCGKWRVQLLLGTTSTDYAVVEESCRLDPAPAQFPLHEAPDIVEWTKQFACFDIDGMRTGVCYSVKKSRAAELRKFLLQSSEERRLPVILVTPNGNGTIPLDYRRLAQLVCGAAHVMMLDKDSDRKTGAWKNSDISDAHPCLGGAVRIFRPGYSPRDLDNVHPKYMPHGQQLRTQDKLELLDQVSILAGASMCSDPLLQQLQQRRQGELDEKVQQSKHQALLAQLSREQEQSGFWEQYATDLETERDRAVAERNRTQQDLTAAHDENRRLRFKLQGMRTPQSAAATGDAADRPYVTLSRQAAQALNGLDPQARGEIESGLLRKLTLEALRENQSEICNLGKNGNFYVYPRSKTNGGQRVIYLLNGAEVRVCELYAHHDVYERGRKQGWTHSDYIETSVWQDGDSEQLLIPLQ
jgi:hypothetical protein